MMTLLHHLFVTHCTVGAPSGSWLGRIAGALFGC
jgi:hypothetical protein